MKKNICEECLINKKILLSFLFFLSFSFISCNKNNGSIFDNIFASIPDNPTDLEQTGNYELTEISETDNNFPMYAKRFDCKKLYILKNDFITITYWNIGGNNQIQFIQIHSKKANHPLSKFIGKKTDTVIRQYPKNTDYEMTKNELRYNSEHYVYSISFYHSDEKIHKILIGRNL